MFRNEIVNRLIELDREAQLIFSDDSRFSCYIVGGSAFILLGYETRATHDIDVLERYQKEISKLFSKYDMNTSVVAYIDNFPNDFEKRALKLEIGTEMIDYYILSLEDLVIAKLCTTRGEQDIIDINSDSVIDKLNWELLDELATLLTSQKVSGLDNFRYNYNNYTRRNK